LAIWPAVKKKLFLTLDCQTARIRPVEDIDKIILKYEQFIPHMKAQSTA